MVIGAAAKGPVELAIHLADRQIVDAGDARRRVSSR
jgi:hypothetical protein